jgi:hypothetical protein
MLVVNVWLTTLEVVKKYLALPLSVSRSTDTADKLELPCYSLINILHRMTLSGFEALPCSKPLD